MSEPSQLAKYEQQADLVAPANVDQVLAAMQRFDEFKQRSITEDDYTVIAGKKFINKSGLMKYALGCSLSHLKLEERREVDEKTGVITYHFTYRSMAPNGRYSDAVGSCSNNEKGYKTEHLCRAMAQTRALNRSTSNLVASGQVSAEEIASEEEQKPKSTLTEQEIKELQEARAKQEATEKAARDKAANMAKPNPLLKPGSDAK